MLLKQAVTIAGHLHSARTSHVNKLKLNINCTNYSSNNSKLHTTGSFCCCFTNNVENETALSSPYITKWSRQLRCRWGRSLYSEEVNSTWVEVQFRLMVNQRPDVRHKELLRPLFLDVTELQLRKFLPQSAAKWWHCCHAISIPHK